MFTGVTASYYTTSHGGYTIDTATLNRYIRVSLDVLYRECLLLAPDSDVSAINTALLHDAQCYLIDSMYEIDTNSSAGDLEAVSFEDVSYKFAQSRGSKASSFDPMSIAKSKMVQSGYCYRGVRS